MKIKDTYFEDINNRFLSTSKKWKEKGLPDINVSIPYPEERTSILQPKRNAIFDVVNKIFYNLQDVSLTNNHVKIEACDQSGWPFIAFEMSLGTGHREEFFYDNVLNVLQNMYNESIKSW